MAYLLARAITATLLLLMTAASRPQQSSTHPFRLMQLDDVTPDFEFQRPTEALASIFERCWRAQELGSNRNSDYDQDVGLFRAEVRLRWCRTSLEARGPVALGGKHGYLAHIDSLTLRLSTDTIIAELRERAGDPPRLMVNGHAANADWWRAGTRERVLRLARVPLP